MADKEGQPGKQGEPGEGMAGGKGGAGGAGGTGQPPGGGGKGGEGGEGAAGRVWGAVPVFRSSTLSWLRWILLGFCLIAVFVFLIMSVYTFFHVRAESEHSHTAICALSDDLHRRAAVTFSFLETHPNGFGEVPAATLRDSAENQEKTADILDKEAHCK